ncbi:hypothetical protein ACOQFB_07960 [Anaeromyxobacter sp. Red801]|uniref:hypothetical protein n=1 Tax=Anaeromyxobacter sp. Red801 TaxID=3411632 RepID=UPI003BA17A04
MVGIALPLALRRKNAPSRRLLWFAPLWIYGLTLGILQSATQDGAGRALRHGLLFGFAFLTMTAAASVRFSWKSFDRLIPALGLCYVLVIVYGVYQVFARRNGWPYAFLTVTNPSLAEETGGVQAGAFSDASWVYVSRASSFFVEPTNFGMFLGYGTAISLAVLERGGKYTRWGTVGLALTGAGFAANQSLTAVLVCGAVLCLAAARAALLASATRVAAMVVAITAAAAIMSALPGVGEMIGGRLADLSVEQSSGRFSSLPRVLSALEERPLGWGFAGHAWLGEMIHNGVLIFLVMFGFAGLLLPVVWVLWILRAWKRSVALARVRDADSSAAAALASALLTVQLAVWSASGILHEPMFWALSGLALGAGHFAREASARVPGDVVHARWRRAT